MTPKLLYEDAVVLKTPRETGNDEYLCLFIKTNYQPPLQYEEEEDNSASLQDQK